MIQYKRCSEVNIDLVYEAFKDGFSDYIIKMEVSKGDFIKRFLVLKEFVRTLVSCFRW